MLVVRHTEVKMLEAERMILEENTDTVDNFIGNVCPPDDICDAWDLLKAHLRTVVQQSLSGSDSKESSPKSCPQWEHPHKCFLDENKRCKERNKRRSKN